MPRGAEDGRRARWQAHRETRRAELVDAAIRAIRRHGAGVGMDEIAAEAGTSKPVIYRHFADRADLYVAVGQRIAQGVVTEITAALQQEEHPRALVSAVIDAYLRVIESDPETYRFVIHRPLLDKPLPDDVAGDYASMVAQHLSQVLGDRLREGGLDSGAAEPWGYALVGMVRAAGDWWLERRSMTRAALTDYLTALLWTGFAGAYAEAGIEVPARLSVRPASRRAGSPPPEREAN